MRSTRQPPEERISGSGGSVRGRVSREGWWMSADGASESGDYWSVATLGDVCIITKSVGVRPQTSDGDSRGKGKSSDYSS